jgi:hypothetical protein
MPKRSFHDAERHHAKKRSQYATDFLPDPWLAQFESEPPGFIRAVRGDMSNCYIKELVSKYVTTVENGPNGPLYTERVRNVYVWTCVK